jgi:glycolate oxidase FAD binding subunit
MAPTTTNLEARLASIVGAERIQADPQKLATYAVDEIIPTVSAQPATAEQAAEIVRFAIAETLAIIPVGNRSKLAIGMPPARYDIALDMTGLNRIAHYDPGDLTLSADAGCTLAIISAALTPQKQFLPLSFAYGIHSTIAGTIASGVDSHLRQFYGTARDFLVGAEFIDGSGAQCKSGGRVVKNVTGYDLHKLLIGSLGTLAIITRLNFRTFPAPTSTDSQSETFIASFSSANSAIAFRQKIAASPFTPHAIEILSPELCNLLRAIDTSAWEPPSAPLGEWFSPSSWHVAILFHGTPELRARYTTALTQLSESAGASASRNLPTATQDVRSANGSEAYTLNALAFDAIRHLRTASPAATIFKVSQLPAKLPDLFASLATIANQANIPYALFARGLGVTYFALLPSDAAPATMTRATKACQEIFYRCATQSAPAQIQFAPVQLKRHINVFGPARPDAPAMRRLKSAFDPHNLFAPGRLS